MTSRWR